jgi:RNA polymerase sigma-70 factor (ECF subfamily)
MAGSSSAANLLGSEEQAESGSSTVATGVPSFEAIYNQYFAFVWSSTRRLGVSPPTTDDVVQEIFMVIHSKLHTLRQAHSLRSWVYGIVRRTVSHHHRSQRTKAATGAAYALEADAFQPMAPTPLDVTTQNDQVKLLWHLLEKLDPTKREVFILAELEEMTAPEIADALEIPLNTAYSRLRAARQAFEEALGRQNAQSQGSV